MPPAAVDPALVEAKKTLAKTCDALTSRSTFFPIFDESKGSVDYARWRRDLFTFVSSSGADFTNGGARAECAQQQHSPSPTGEHRGYQWQL